jgi:hypothetical protein
MDGQPHSMEAGILLFSFTTTQNMTTKRTSMTVKECMPFPIIGSKYPQLITKHPLLCIAPRLRNHLVQMAGAPLNTQRSGVGQGWMDIGLLLLASGSPFIQKSSNVWITLKNANNGYHGIQMNAKRTQDTCEFTARKAVAYAPMLSRGSFRNRNDAESHSMILGRAIFIYQHQPYQKFLRRCFCRTISRFRNVPSCNC